LCPFLGMYSYNRQAPPPRTAEHVGPLLDRVYSLSDEIMAIKRGLDDLTPAEVKTFRDAGSAVKALEPIVKKHEK